MNNTCLSFDSLPVVEQELHVVHCTRCAHELRWQKSERELFRQRESKTQVAALWKEFESTQVSSAKPKTKWVAFELTALAAAALVLLSVAFVKQSMPSASATQHLEDFPMTQVLASYETHRADACSKMPDGLGFHCGPGVPASFLASRE
jgi:hypothetical protein